MPGLLGRKRLHRWRALVDCFANKLYTVGPGGYKISLSPGSRVYDLKESYSGHLILPCTRYTAKRGQSSFPTAEEPADCPRRRTCEGTCQYWVGYCRPCGAPCERTTGHANLHVCAEGFTDNHQPPHQLTGENMTDFMRRLNFPVLGDEALPDTTRQ